MPLTIAYHRLPSLTLYSNFWRSDGSDGTAGAVEQCVQRCILRSGGEIGSSAWFMGIMRAENCWRCQIAEVNIEGEKQKKQNAPDLTWQDMNDDLTGTCALRRIHWIWLNQMQFQNWALVFEPIQNSKFDPRNTCEFMIQPIFGVDFERSWAPGPPASAALASSVQCIWCAKSDFWKLHNLHMHMTCTWHAHDMHMTCTCTAHALHMHCTCSHFWTIFETDKRKQTGNKQDKLGISCHKLGRFLASKHKTHCANTSNTSNKHFKTWGLL